MDVTTRYDLRDLLMVANTRHGPGGHHHARARIDGPDHDHLRDPADARDFLADHDVAVPAGLPGPSALRGLRALREAVRSRIEDGPKRRIPTAGRYRLGADGRLASTASDAWRALVEDLRLPLVELVAQPVGDEGLKICGNPLCRWVFIDRSRNRSRRWCDMAACGNRAKVARHRMLARAG